MHLRCPSHDLTGFNFFSHASQAVYHPHPNARRAPRHPRLLRCSLLPFFKLETDPANPKEALAEDYRQLNQIQGQLTLLGAGRIKTAKTYSDLNECKH
ncbi:hypothetical protein CF328_g5824 [Tilletia controversa]|nr:hypothetical protein CF328_g5824 [Tilletia controversa]